MPSYYALLSPLISAFDAYVANTANGISKVYVTGHSMGGTMALEYMSHHSGNQYQAVTFAASPFGDTSFFVPFRKNYLPDSRITQIEVAKDTVPMLFDARVGLSVGNTRPGQLISFAGDQTLTVDMTNPSNHISAVGGFGVDYYGRTANHSMDYYRQITDSVDADSWTKILAGTGTQTVLLGGQQLTGTDNFVVDGQLSGTNTSYSNGNDQLASIDFKVIYGGKGNDTLVAGTNPTQLLGGVGDDMLGNDDLNGGGSNDIFDGGIGTDTAVYGVWSAYAVTGTATSAIVIALTGGHGTDTLSSIENLIFNGVTVTTEAAFNDAPIGVSDNNASDAVIEAGAGIAGDSRAVGNVLNNDTDADSALGLGETKTVKTVNNQIVNVGRAVLGVYGSLILLADGSYTYTLDNTKAVTNNLSTGQVVSDTFTYTVVDAHGATSVSTTLNISITGSNDVLSNTAPTLTSFSTAVATGNEDSEIAISFASLQAQGNAADVDGTVTAFVIKAVNTGSLKIGTDALTASAWSASNNTVDATHQAYWTPALNTNGTVNAFTAVAKDNGGMESSTPVQATVSITSVNDAPTLTSFTAAVASGAEDSEIAISFASLQAQGNAADVDGSVTAFVIKAVNTGSLKIGTDALNATAWSVSNNTVDAIHQAYWTPALNTNGTLNAFTVVTKDNGGLESITPVQATVNIGIVNDVPTLSSFSTAVATGNEDSEIAISFANLQAQGNAADVDGTVTAFVIKAVNTGSLKIGTDALTASAWSASNNTVDATHQAYWTPVLNTNGTLNAFTTVAKDNGGLESSTPVQATVSIAAVNDAPVLAHALIDQWFGQF